MRSPAVRLALTILLPLLLVLAGDQVLLPGMADLFDTVARRTPFLVDRSNASVFALGITPVIEAYGVVELAAFLVKKWSRLRHGNPEGRVKLERAARIVAMVLAAFQAWSVAGQFTRLDLSGSMFGTGAELASTPVMVATLVGGVCVQIVVAEIISRQRIANGYVLLTVVGAIAALRGTFLEPLRKALVLETVETRHFVLMVLVLVLPGVATWLAVRGAGDARAVTVDDGGSAGPYRAARALVLSPWVPVPSSSMSPFPMAIALISLPLSLAILLRLGREAEISAMSLHGSVTFTILMVVLAGGLGLGFAKLLHRPPEMAEVASRLGFSGGEELRSKARAAVNATLLPTLLFFATLALATSAGMSLPAAPAILFVPLLVALVMDAAGSLRASKLVAVWQERRASAVPVVRAVLAAEGIEATARGMSVLSLLQIFAPYAPAEIMVPEADAARATAILRHVFLGDARAETEARAEAIVPSDGDGGTRWTPGRRLLGLVGVVALSLVGLVSANVRPKTTENTKEPRGRLEIVRVDDDNDVMGQLRDEDVPSGIDVRFENAPAGPGKTLKNHFAMAHMNEGETYDAAVKRMRTWTDRLTLPEGTRIGLEAVDDFDPDTGKSQRTGVRTFLLTGPPVITTDDVVGATPAVNDMSGAPEAYVAVTLSEDGGERFRIATRDYVQRRIAIIVNGQIESAPVVKTMISGGHISITMGAGDYELQLAQAKKLARSLGGPGTP